MRIVGGTFVPDPYRVIWLRFEEHEARLACTGVHLDRNSELTARQLTELPFGAIVEQARGAVEMIANVKLTGRRRRGRIGFDDEFYKEIARFYRKAVVVHPRAPIRWMAEEGLPEEFRGSVETVRRWVHQARRRGHLGRSIPGRAGEEES